MTAVWAGQFTGQLCQFRRWLQLELAEGIPPRDQAKQTRATSGEGTSLPSWERVHTGLWKVSVHGNGWLNTTLPASTMERSMHMISQAKPFSVQVGFQVKHGAKENWFLTNFPNFHVQLHYCVYISYDRLLYHRAQETTKTNCTQRAYKWLGFTMTISKIKVT